MFGRLGGRVTTSISPALRAVASIVRRDVELVVRALADERAQPAQGHLELADVQGHVGPVAAVAAGVGDVDGGAPATRSDPVLRPAGGRPALAERRGALPVPIQ